MTQWRSSIVGCVVLALLWPAAAFAVPTVTVLADNSMASAVSALARDYTRRNQVVVSGSFAQQAEQQAQIEEGGAADVLITVRDNWIEGLQRQGLIDFLSRKEIARNRLVLVGPQDSELAVSLAQHFPSVALIQDMQQRGTNQALAIGNPETLNEGSYAKDALRSMSALDDLGEYIVFVKRLDQLFSLIANHQAYGVLYASTVLGRSDTKVLGLLPEATHRPISYQAVVIAGDNMNEARKFLDYLQSKPAKAILKLHGFETN
jgi:molybdate transport system substrate-binding protein